MGCRTSFAGGEDEGYFVIRRSQVRLLPWLRSCSSAVEHRKLPSSPNSPANVYERSDNNGQTEYTQSQLRPSHARGRSRPAHFERAAAAAFGAREIGRAHV